VADAVDYSQSGTVYRYSADGKPIDQFRTGINPNGFAFK
jgi:sugar lactone lactonase YvrE